jgi:hypothetical protein
MVSSTAVTSMGDTPSSRIQPLLEVEQPRHAHFGTEKGVTEAGVQVRNVAQPVIGSAYALYDLAPR